MLADVNWVKEEVHPAAEDSGVYQGLEASHETR